MGLGDSSNISIFKMESSLRVERAKAHLGISKYHRLSFPQKTKTIWNTAMKNHLLVLIIQFLFLPSRLRAIIISWQITLIISWSNAGLFFRINCWSARHNWLQFAALPLGKKGTVYMNWTYNRAVFISIHSCITENTTLFTLTHPSVASPHKTGKSKC